MFRYLSVALSMLAVALWVGCGSAGDPEDDGLPDGMGAIEFVVNGGNDTNDGDGNDEDEDPVLAYIVVQNLVDKHDIRFIECERKPHLLDGLPFCDELLILPPGVYDIYVQSADPDCVSEKAFYKVQVEAGKVTEKEVRLLCADETGGLDVIVIEERKPRIEDILFSIGEEKANKFMCKCTQVDVTALVSHPDGCERLSSEWTLRFGGVTIPPENGNGEDPNDNGDDCEPNGLCEFTYTVDTCALDKMYPDHYDLTVEITWDPDHEEEGHQPLTSSLTIPIYIIDCDLECEENE